MIAKLKLPDFIVTLGMLSIYRGAALIYTDGKPIYGIDETFRSIFAGELFGIPTPVLLAVAIAVASFLLVKYTALGEQIIAVGGNEEAARLSGINTDRVKICVYALWFAFGHCGFRPHWLGQLPSRWRQWVRVAGDRRSRD
jgi:ribose transport system permease protein